MKKNVEIKRIFTPHKNNNDCLALVFSQISKEKYEDIYEHYLKIGFVNENGFKSQHIDTVLNNYGYFQTHLCNVSIKQNTRSMFIQVCILDVLKALYNHKVVIGSFNEATKKYHLSYAYKGIHYTTSTTDDSMSDIVHAIWIKKGKNKKEDSIMYNTRTKKESLFRKIKKIFYFIRVQLSYFLLYGKFVKKDKVNWIFKTNCNQEYQKYGVYKPLSDFELKWVAAIKNHKIEEFYEKNYGGFGRNSHLDPDGKLKDYIVFDILSDIVYHIPGGWRKVYQMINNSFSMHETIVIKEGQTVRDFYRKIMAEGLKNFFLYMERKWLNDPNIAPAYWEKIFKEFADEYGL